MVTSSVSSTGVEDIAGRIMQRFDTNNDGQLSSNEFGVFLQQLLGSVGSTKSALAVATTGTSATSPTKTYSPMAGFDTGKLNDPTHSTPKYIFARAWQDSGAAGFYGLQGDAARHAYMESFLQSLVAQFAAQGWNVLAIDGEQLQLQETGGVAHWIDTIGDLGGEGRPQWIVPD